jgi:hypothetical protein
MFSSEASTGCDDRLPSRQVSHLAHNLTAFGEYGGPAGAMNGAIHSASA